MMAPRQFAIKFAPKTGNLVPATTFVKVLSDALEGLAGLRHALAPIIADEHGWTTADVRDALEFGFTSTERGSVLVPIHTHAARPLLIEQTVEAQFWSTVPKLLSAEGMRVGRDMLLSGRAASSFARAARAAAEGGSTLSFVARNSSREWIIVFDLSANETSLREYAEIRDRAESSRVELLGTIVSISYDPPQIVLDSPRGKLSVKISAKDRETARQLWGKAVIVSARARVSSEGDVFEPVALEIRSTTTASALLLRFDRVFGSLKDVWDTDEAREYIKKLRQ